MSVNAALAERFSLIAKLMDVLGEDRFKVLAHAKAARIIGDLAQDLEPIARLPAPEARKRLVELEGVGPKIADKIVEFVTTGTIGELDELRARVPAGLVPLMDIPGLGPKTVAVLWQQGKVEDLAGLKRIIADGSILNLPRMGEKAVAKIEESIALAEQGSQRLNIGLATPIAERIVEHLKKVRGVKHVACAGSARRGRETVGDLDILVTATDPGAVGKAFRAMPEVRQSILAGETKSSVRIAINPDMGRWTLEGQHGKEAVEPTIQVDLRVLDDSSWGAALMYFTGSKEHNVGLRERALKMGMTLNEYGLFPRDDADEPPQKRGIKPVAAKTEEEVYKKLGLEFIPPELREDRGEVVAFERTAKPGKGAGERGSRGADALIELSDIKAELHAHTTASDGRLSILELASEAKRRGFHTIAVTDHSKSSVIANGLRPDRLRKHIGAIHAARDRIKGITILAGSEVDILSDGSLDYDDDLLAELDIVVASPHVALSQDPATATRRLLGAVRHPMVHILGHPTGRLINKRAGLSPDMPELIAAAKEHNVALEINAHWMRLDLRDTHVRAAVEGGAMIAIDCDVHEVADYDNLRFGVMTGRRGWLTAEGCINTWAGPRLHKWLRAKR